MSNLGNYRKAKQNIRDKVLDTDHVLNKTAIFSPNGFEAGKLDQKTLEIVKERYLNWFNSWVKDDLELITK